VHLIEEEDRTKREGFFVTQTLNQQLSATKHGVQDDCSQIALADFGVPRLNSCTTSQSQTPNSTPQTLNQNPQTPNRRRSNGNGIAGKANGAYK
jgi:hypothetical protein